MRLTTLSAAVALAITGLSTDTAFAQNAQASEQEIAELRAQVAALMTRIDDLEARDEVVRDRPVHDHPGARGAALARNGPGGQARHLVPHHPGEQRLALQHLRRTRGGEPIKKPPVRRGGFFEGAKGRQTRRARASAWPV